MRLARLSSSRRFLCDARGAIAIEYLLLASVALGIAVAIGTLVLTVEEINARAQEILPLNVP